MMWWGSHWSWWGWAFMSISMVVFWGLVIWGVVSLARRSGESGAGVTSVMSRRTSPEEILAERFARGEIDASEYHARLDALRDRTPVG